MRTTLTISQAYGTPVAMKNAAGEWVEVGYISDLEFTMEQEESVEFLTLPYKLPKTYSMELDVEANEAARALIIEIVQQARREEGYAGNA